MRKRTNRKGIFVGFAAGVPLGAGAAHLRGLSLAKRSATIITKPSVRSRFEKFGMTYGRKGLRAMKGTKLGNRMLTHFIRSERGSKIILKMI